MSVARADFTATMLADGRVLLAGGQSNQASTGTAEIFNPGRNTINPAAPMRSARFGHTATLLASGKVLVTGGSVTVDGPVLATAELYDPATDSWSAAARMTRPRTHHAAIRLDSGRVLVAGGATDNRLDAPNWELYDPATNTWTVVPAPAAGPNGPTATALPDGRVLVEGGWSVAGPYTAEFFDPNTGRWTYGRSVIPTNRVSATAALLANGSVIFVGGELPYAEGALSSTDIYSPSDAWVAGPAMQVGHCHHTMTTLKTGALLVAGGRCGSSDSIAISELYDPNIQKWSLGAPLLEPVGFASAVLLRDGRVLVAGGFGTGGALSSLIQIYTPD